MSINVTVSGGTGIDAAPETTVDVQGGIGPAAFVNHLGEVVGVNPIVAGTGITITTASGTLTISGRSDGDVASLSPVLSVNNYTGEVALNVQDLTAAAAVHTHSTTDVTGLTATIQQYGNVTSVNSYTGDVTLTVQDLTAAAAVHTHSTTDVTGLTATIQQYGNVTSVNSYTGDVTLTVQDLTAAAAVHNHTRDEITDLTGSDISFSPYRVLFSNVYSTLGDLPSATDNHGCFVHVHSEGRAYYAHAGAWVPLANEDDITVSSVNNYTGDVTLTVQDLTAAAAVHTHSTTDVTGLTATIQQYGKVLSVNSYTGDVTLTVQDLTAAAAVHTHSTTEVTGLTATIQQYGKVLSVNSYTGDVTLTVQDLTAAAAVHTHSTTEVTGLTATIQQYGNVTSVNNYTGDVTLTMQDLGDVSSSPPSIGDALLWNGTEWSGASLGGTTTQAAAETSAGHGLFVDQDGSLATVSDPPRDVDLAAFGNTSLKATFFRDRPGDLSRGLVSYEVDFIAVGSLPAVVVAEQSPAASRTMDVQGVLQDGDSFAELGVSADNGTTWNNVTLASEDDSGIVAIKSVPAGSQRAGERLYRIRSADTIANLSLATYSQNISATYNVNGYYPPLPLQIYNSGDSLTAIAAFSESDVERPEINLSAANVAVGIELMAAGSEPTYAFTGLAVDYPRYFDDDPIYSENNAVFQSLVTTSSEGGWVSAFLRAGGEEGVGDQYESGSLTYYFAGNYSLPKSPDDVFPGVFLVADAVSATNLPAGVTAGEWSGGVGVTSDSPSYYHLAYRPDPSQEFEYADGSTSVVTLTAKVSSVEDAAMRLYVESQTMFAANDQNANQTFTTEPTITLELRDQSSVLVANATSTDITGNALAVLAASLVGQQVYDLTATVSNPAGGRGYIPMIKFDPVALEAT